MSLRVKSRTTGTSNVTMLQLLTNVLVVVTTILMMSTFNHECCLCSAFVVGVVVIGPNHHRHFVGPIQTTPTTSVASASASVSSTTTTTTTTTSSTSLYSAVVLGDHHNGGIANDWLRRQRRVIGTQPSVMPSPSSQSSNQEKQKQKQHLQKLQKNLQRNTRNPSVGDGNMNGFIPQVTKIQSLEHFRQHINSNTKVGTTATITAGGSNEGSEQAEMRYTVVKFHASWCKTCAKFGIRFDKLVSKYSDWVSREQYHPTLSNQQQPIIHRSGPLRFASVEYSTNSAIFDALDVTHLPTVHVYDPHGNKVLDCPCPPSKFQDLVDKVELYVSLYNYQKIQHDVIQHSSRSSLAFTSSIDSNHDSVFTNVEEYSSSISSSGSSSGPANHLQTALYQQSAVAAMQVSYRARAFDVLTKNNNIDKKGRNWWKRLSFLL